MEIESKNKLEDKQMNDDYVKTPKTIIVTMTLNNNSYINDFVSADLDLGNNIYKKRSCMCNEM